MEAKGWILFNVLRQKYHPQDANALLSVLSQEDKLKATQHVVTSQDPLPALAFPEKRLKNIHYSWLVPTIQALPDSLRSWVLASLPKEHQHGVCRLTQTSVPKVKPAEPIRKFLLKDLILHTTPLDLLPSEYLPESPLKFLASMSKDELVNLIDYLGLRDLAEAVRPIVDKRLLQAIHQCLTPMENQLLRAYLHQREKLKVSKLELARWDGKRDTLRLLYHQRGLVRLGKALSGITTDLFWHITHRLDRPRALVIERLWTQEEIPGVTKALIQQILVIIDFLKRSKDGQ